MYIISMQAISMYVLFLQPKLVGGKPRNKPNACNSAASQCLQLVWGSFMQRLIRLGRRIKGRPEDHLYVAELDKTQLPTQWSAAFTRVPMQTICSCLA